MKLSTRPIGMTRSLAFGVCTMVLAFSVQDESTATFVGVGSSFDGATPGTPVPFTVISLPSVNQTLGHGPPPPRCPWAPTFDDLVTGDTIITTEAQMRYVWRRLFTVPFDDTLFHFDTEFVVIMGDGEQTITDFTITAVEEFEGIYSCGYGCDTAPEKALTVTGTVTVPGVKPDPLPRPEFKISAVAVGMEYYDDILFHRVMVFFP